MNFLSSLIANRYVLVFLTSMLPLIEIRGGMPAGIALGLSFWEAYPIAVLGNILPVPFLILFSKKVVSFLAEHNYLGTGGFFKRLIKKADSKASSIGTYELLGLFLFVAVPVPGTGAWTASLIAAFLRLRLVPAFLAILLGVLSAGIIMGVLSFGILEAAGALFF